MTEPERPIEQALRHVAPRWDDTRSARTLLGAQRKLSARRRRTAAMTAAGVLGLMLAGGSWLRGVGPSEQATAPRAATTPLPRSVSFDDGSRALLLDDTADVVVSRVSSKAIDVRLTNGRARFDVSHDPGRIFRVDCGAVVVEVLGTSFDLTRHDDRTRVQVREGRVRVRFPGGMHELGMGEDGWFPPLALTTNEPDPEATEPPPDDTPTPSAKKARAGWQRHAAEGDFGRAYALLEQWGKPVADDVEDLLLAADAARLSGHPEQALPFLQKITDRHARDPRAPLAAFTLGGVLMNQLGRPREAERAYARARALTPPSSLAQDALARQVEAAHRAGDDERARSLANEYVERYPNGRRVNAVRRFGGLP